MISRLPRWVWGGSAVLAALAGMVNAVGFLSFLHQGVSHLTGNTTLLGVAIAQGDVRQVAHFLAVIGAFVGGCMLSGAIVQDSALQLGRRYGVALGIEAALLIVAVPFLEHQITLGAYLAACACGMQNGMAGTYSGAVLRTTHVSGAFTDLGIFLGQRLRGLAVDNRRMKLCSCVIAGFIVGAALGTLGFARFSYRTLFFPGAALGAVAIAYMLYRSRHMAEGARESRG